MTFRPLHIISLTAVLMVSLTTFGLCEDREKVSNQIDQLIQQLGSSSYLEREQAETKLLEFNMEAFEPLTQARKNKDPEIAARARYLVRQIQVNLVTPDDSPKVAALMRNIFSLDRRKQENQIAELSMLPDGEGLAALCRLVRFAESETSAKTAAVGIIQSRLYSKKDLAAMDAKLSPLNGYPNRNYSLNVYQTQNLFQAQGAPLDGEKQFGQPLGQKERDEIRRVLKSCDRPAVEMIFTWFDFAEAKTDAEKKAAYAKWDKLCQKEETLLTSNPTAVAPAIFAFMLKIQLQKSVELKLSEDTQIELVRRQLKRTHFWNRTHYQEIINRLIDEKIWKLAGISIPEFGTVMIRAYNQDTLPRFFCLLIHADKNDAGKAKIADKLLELYEKSFQPQGTAKATFHLGCAPWFSLKKGSTIERSRNMKRRSRLENLPTIPNSGTTPTAGIASKGIMDMYEGLEQFELSVKTSDEMLKKLDSLTDTQKKRAEVNKLIKKTKSHRAYYRAMGEKKKGNDGGLSDAAGRSTQTLPRVGQDPHRVLSLARDAKDPRVS